MSTNQPAVRGADPGAGRWCRRAALLAGCLALAGCGGPQAVDVSGTVTFDGKPVPAGRIYFNPDVTKGNDGPQGYAEIRDGKFDTRDGGKAAFGGPTVAVIRGYDGVAVAPGSAGSPLFRDYKEPIDLPKAPCTWDFNVPATAGLRKPARTGPGP